MAYLAGAWTKGYNAGVSQGPSTFDNLIVIGQDANGEKYTQFTAPRASTFSLSLRVPISVIIRYNEGIYGGESPAIIKIFAIVERYIGGAWVPFAASKYRLDEMPPSNNNGRIGVDQENSAIWWNGNSAYTNPVVGTLVIDNLQMQLNTGDKIRVKHYMVEMYRFFIRGQAQRFEIMNDVTAKKIPYLEIIDTLASATSYALTASISQNIGLFEISGSTSNNRIKFSNTASVLYNQTQFLPIGSSVSASYTTVENPFTINQGDILRIGSFYSKNAPYFIVNNVYDPQVNFNGNNGTYTITRNLSIEVDRSVDYQLADSGSNMVILRRKPDETSVIINFIKPPGETSQALLLSDDLSTNLKNEAANIASNLSQQLNQL
jgi:hypothetical protein